MADYSQSDVNSMRQDAIRRVREMQRRSQGYLNRVNSPCPEPPKKPAEEKPPEKKAPPEQKNANRNPPPQNPRQNGGNFRNQGFGGNPFSMFTGNPPKPAPKPCAERCEEKPVPEKPCSESQKKKGPISGLLESFFPGTELDEDRIIIILLIVLLSREGADIKLLLALGYLML